MTNRNLSVQQRLDRALASNDYKTVFEISKKRLQKDPTNQLAIKLLLFGSKHDKNTFPEVLKYKDLVKFPEVIDSQIDYEALLMLLDIIHACESLSLALEYVCKFVDRLGQANHYYNELLYSTIGVKFCAFAEPELSLKYHEKAMSLVGSTFLSKYNYAHSLIEFGRYEEAIQPYRARWEWPSFPSTQRLFDIPELPLDRLELIDKDARIYIWSEQGLGDQMRKIPAVVILAAQGYTNLTFEVHSKLCDLMIDSMGSIKIIPQPFSIEQFDSRNHPDYQVEQYDYQVAAYDLFLKIQKSSESHRVVSKIFRFNNHHGASFRDVILEDQPNKVLIGIHWSSALMDPVRNRTYLNNNDLKALAVLNDRAVFVSFNYSLTVEEVNQVRTETGLNLVGIKDIDQSNDLYNTTSLMLGMDVFIGVMSSPTWQAAFSGVPTISVEFSENPGKKNKFPQVAPNHRHMVGVAGYKADLLDNIAQYFDQVIDWARNTRC